MIKKFLQWWNVWSLYHRHEIVWFSAGAITASVLIIILSIIF